MKTSELNTRTIRPKVGDRISSKTCHVMRETVTEVITELNQLPFSIKKEQEAEYIPSFVCGDTDFRKGSGLWMGTTQDWEIHD